MRLKANEDGFTLTEVLVAMLLMMLVVFALYSMFDMSLRVFKVGNDTVKSNASARTAMDQMEREVRSAWNPSPNSCSGNSATGALLDTSATGPSQITFYNCLAGSPSPIKIKYSVASGYLVRTLGSSGTSERVAKLGSGNLELKYFNSSNAIVSPGPTVALVRIKIVATDGGSTQTLVTNTALRNRSL